MASPPSPPLASCSSCTVPHLDHLAPTTTKSHSSLHTQRKRKSLRPPLAAVAEAPSSRSECCLYTTELSCSACVSIKMTCVSVLRAQHGLNGNYSHFLSDPTSLHRSALKVLLNPEICLVICIQHANTHGFIACVLSGNRGLLPAPTWIPTHNHSSHQGAEELKQHLTCHLPTLCHQFLLTVRLAED